MDNDRFSIMILEQDVLEYHKYKTKYNEYYELHSRSIPGTEKEQLKETRDYYYTKYINKMKYLERNYRKTNIYTNYHQQLEKKQRGRSLRSRRHSFQYENYPSAPPLPTQRPRSLTPIKIPTAVPIPSNRNIRSTSPISVLTFDHSLPQSAANTIVVPEENCRILP